MGSYGDVLLIILLSIKNTNYVEIS